MLKIFGPRLAKRILRRRSAQLDEISVKYRIPTALLKAVLLKEMTEIDLLDLAADLVVSTGLFSKKDSSTGYGQVFGSTAVRSINFAVDRGLTSYQSLNLKCDHRLDEGDSSDVRRVWRRLHRNQRFNMEIAALTLLCAADEMTGKSDFSRFTDEEFKLTLTRYNADVRHITPYGESVYAIYKSFLT